MIVVSPSDTGIRQARAKTDRLDARALAKLLSAGELDGVWALDERIRLMRRRLSRRAQLVRARTSVKNEIQAVLMRCLKERPPVSDLFGVKGRRWLNEQQLSVCERETVDSALRHVDFLDTEIAQVERLIGAEASRDLTPRLLHAAECSFSRWLSSRGLDAPRLLPFTAGGVGGSFRGSARDGSV
ncbi:MAG: transposase [Actinobacteria bacterium]|nr:transposase [Actinomycetota bacterium]